MTVPTELVKVDCIFIMLKLSLQHKRYYGLNKSVHITNYFYIWCWSAIIHVLEGAVQT